MQDLVTQSLLSLQQEFISLMKVNFKHFHMKLKNFIRLALFINSKISVTGSDVYRACGGEGYDGQDVFCTTGPYFHVQMQKMFLKIVICQTILLSEMLVPRRLVQQSFQRLFRLLSHDHNQSNKCNQCEDNNH